MGSSRHVFHHAADLHVDGPEFDAPMLLDFRTAMFSLELFEAEIDDGLDDGGRSSPPIALSAAWSTTATGTISTTMRPMNQLYYGGLWNHHPSQTIPAPFRVVQNVIAATTQASPMTFMEIPTILATSS